jgi:ribose-phosphate pyrophosphokinase
LESTPHQKLHLLGAQSNLAQKVAERLDVKMGEAEVIRFANGEVNYRLGDSVREEDVFIFQAHDGPVNETVMDLLILIDAAKRASARTITAVCPFFSYARQDRKSKGREPITAKLVVDMLQTAGADRIVSVDLHSGQIQGFFDGPFDHLTAMPVLTDYIKKNFKEDLVMVAPDAGRVKMAERYVGQLGGDLAIVHKSRSYSKANTSEAREVVGNVKDRVCILMDDMIDTAGTICTAAELLKEHGAKKIYAVTTHAVLSDPATQRLRDSVIDKVIVTDTLPLKPESKLDKIECVSVAGILADAISAIFYGHSVSKLFQGENQI